MLVNFDILIEFVDDVEESLEGQVFVNDGDEWYQETQEILDLEDDDGDVNELKL